MTFMGLFTLYKIQRNHDNKSGLFIVSVPEVAQYGIGLQVNLCCTLYGVSVHTPAISNTVH